MMGPGSGVLAWLGGRGKGREGRGGVERGELLNVASLGG